MLQKYGGEMDYALVRYTRTEFIVDAYFRNCPMPNYVFRYTYNEIAERGNQSAPAITLVEEEINLVQRMAFSRLCDKKAELKMKSGRIYI